MNVRSVLLVGLGGATGSILRYLLSRWIPVAGNNFPLPTFIINVTGCLIIGVLSGVAARVNWPVKELMLVLATGFCGGFTTFSTLALENINLISAGNMAVAAFYTALSLIIGFLLCYLGYRIAVFV